MASLLPSERGLIVDVLSAGEDRGDAKPGDMVIVQITRWPTPTRSPTGRVIEVLGDIDEPGVNREIIIRKYGINDRHSDEAVAEAKRLAAAISEKDIRGRTDFRKITTVTI